MHYYSIPGFATASQKRTPEQIIEAVSDYFDVSIRALKSKSRTRQVALVRMTAMYFLKEKTELSLRAISRMFNRSDHSTTINALKVVKDLEFSDKVFKNQLAELKFLLK